MTDVVAEYAICVYPEPSTNAGGIGPITFDVPLATATTWFESAIAGNDLAALQHAIDAFGAATNPLAHLLMNAVLKQALGGVDPEKLDANQL